MRAVIRIEDLTRGQVDWLHGKIQDSYHVPDTAVPVCVTFNMGEAGEKHAEMTVRMFIALMSQIQAVDVMSIARQVAAAGSWTRLPTAEQVNNLTADEVVELTRRMNTEPTCPHGMPLVRVIPSIFQRADPMHEYEDGCQMVGPTDTQAFWEQWLATGSADSLPPLPPKWSAPLSGPSENQGWRDETTGLVSGGLVTED